MDIRFCLRVREPRDTDLILGQGMTNTGWHPHKLTQPGESLLSDPEHTTPERHRAYLLTDTRRDHHAAQRAPLRPRLKATGPVTPSAPSTGVTSPPTAPPGLINHPRPETTLWDALVDAGPAGVPVAELETACGMGRRWIYYRLQEHAKAGRAIQARRSHWHAARAVGPPPGSDGE